MSTLLFIARLVLAAVFGVAAISKVTSPPRVRESVIAFGIPGSVATPFAALLVAAEVAAAVALVSKAGAWYGALGALGLLTLFSVGITVNLLRNNRPNCNCFGQLRAEPIGWPSLWRNAALSAIAAAVIVYGRDARSYPAFWPSALNAAQLFTRAAPFISFALLGAIAVILLQILRQQGRMLLRLDEIEERMGGSTPARPLAAPLAGLVPGTPAPAFTLPDLAGIPESLDDLLSAQKPVLLIFSNPTCGPCKALLPDIVDWSRDFDDLMIVLISRTGAAADFEGAAALGAERVLIQGENEVAEVYDVHGTPAAVAIAPDGRIASFVAQGGDAIRGLVSAMRANNLPLAASPHLSAVGEAAPDLTLETSAGERFALADLRGAPALLLFWNQLCGFCQKMLPELRAWEANAPANAPRLIVVLNGNSDDVRALGVHSTVVFDQDSRLSEAFGANGTPMAVLLDADGHIASELAAGAQAFFALAARSIASGNDGLVAASAG
jgi:thiol-disulfide isomerase/thioredoxin/uncharacterized membrane protein YphA (DoxX/SURF4 family)